MCVFEKERECVNWRECVCERGRIRVCLCVSEKDRKVRVCVCEREREYTCERE